MRVRIYYQTIVSWNIRNGDHARYVQIIFILKTKSFEYPYLWTYCHFVFFLDLWSFSILFIYFVWVYCYITWFIGWFLFFFILFIIIIILCTNICKVEFNNSSLNLQIFCLNTFCSHLTRVTNKQKYTFSSLWFVVSNCF